MAVLLVDLDDTLVDRAQVMREWAADTARRYSGDDDLEDWLIAWDRDGDDAVRDRREFLSGVRIRLNIGESVDHLLQWWPDEFGGRYRLDKETEDVLHSTRRQGIPVVIVTNGMTAHQEAKLNAIGARDLVDGWVISEQAGMRKPDRRIFELAAASVGHALTGSWMVGDNPIADIGGAAGAGVQAVWVDRHHRGWVGDGAAPPTFSHPAPAIDYAAAAMVAASSSIPAGADPRDAR